MRSTVLRELIVIAWLSCLIAMGGCGSGGDDGGGDIVVGDPSGDSGPPTPPAHKNLFTDVSDADWDETAVRKVLHAFAFGGQTSDGQIHAWADMAPEFAIEQMLTFDEHNLLLSPPALGDIDGLANRGGTLRELAEFWASDDPANGVTPEYRHRYVMTNTTGSMSLLWDRAVVSRGLNPFRQKIGFWETNYHLAVSLSTVGRKPLLRYYDDIMEAHEQGLPYQRVLAVAASSAAIALQYGHRSNRYRNGVCECNEDFAREFHQLFFGILGDTDPIYHEHVSIKNTAKVLTDMRVHFDEQTGVSDTVDFGTAYHPSEPLEILRTIIGGTNASERIDELVEISINHPESLANLPVMIVRDLADDNLNDTKIEAIREAWAAMSEKTLLTFLRGYAISTIFHDTERVKHLSSFDRHLLLSNMMGLSNREQYLGLYRPDYYNESVQAFMPTHDVFGTQTGLEAASSDLVFRQNFNLVTERVWRFRKSAGNAHGQDWEKDWAAAIPPNPAGSYIVKDIAEWLWKRFLADGLKNFGPLERAHIYALLASGTDFVYLLDPNDLERTLRTADALTDPVVMALMDELAAQFVSLDSQTAEDRLRANERVGMAINFIAGTPYVFAQEGR